MRIPARLRFVTQEEILRFAQDCGWRQILRLHFGKPQRRSGFRLPAPALLSLRSRLQPGSKCNEALSRDLWPLDPFESAPMRATSSGISNSIPGANYDSLKTKVLAGGLSGKSGRNSLTLKKLLCGFFSGQDLRRILPVRDGAVALFYKPL